MKYLKAGVVAVMILAVSGTAGAVSLKPGPAFFHAENWDMATIYVHDTPGVYDPGDFTPWDGVGVPPAVPYKIVPKGAEPNEDSWGVFRLREIIEGRIKPDGYIAPDSPTPYWRSGDNNEEILGVFWGLQDTQVTIKQDLSWEVTADNMHDNMQLELWCMPAAGFGAFYPPVAGSAGRTAFNRYAGWVDGTGTPLLRGESGSYVYTSNFASPSLEGQTTMYVKVDDTLASWQWNPLLGKKDYFSFAVPETDLYMSLQIGNASLGDWDAYSSDEGQAYVIPEPLTMLGVFVGVAGLVRYGRRRLR